MWCMREGEKQQVPHDGGAFLLYQTEDGRIRIETRLHHSVSWVNVLTGEDFCKKWFA